MLFTPINIKKWTRAQTFYYFSKIAPTGYSISVEIDITHMKEEVQKREIKFFPAFLWVVTKKLNEQQEFKTAIKDGVLGYFDVLTPLYATFHEDDHTFSLMWSEYSDAFQTFYNSYITNQKKYGENHGILAQPATPPINSYTVSSIPWVKFSHFAIHSYENKEYFFPSVEAGMFYEKNNRFYMPLSLTLHHATTDGYHVSLFLRSLQKDIDSFEKYL